MFEKVKFQTAARQELFNLTESVKNIVSQSGIQEGLCYVYCPHTTGGLIVNSHMDPKTAQDILFEIDRMVPTRVDFYHTVDTPSDAAGHVKSSLVGVHQMFLIHEGKLALGHSQGILFAEFDGPRQREVFVKLVDC